MKPILLTFSLFIAASIALTTGAVASHNSAGVHVGVISPQAVDDGELNPRASEELALEFHVSEYEQGIIPEPRESPRDQTGQRYSDCTTYQELGSSYSPAENRVHCYIGYFETFRMFHPAPLFPQFGPNDPLYFLNPDAEDDYCDGTSGDEEVTGIQPFDSLVVGFERSIDDRCQGKSHDYYHVGSIQIDSNLLESEEVYDAIYGDESPGGSSTFPLTTRTYILIFGQSHPDNPSKSKFEAGSGPFGPNPSEFGNPVHDLTGVCGDRTMDCNLLTPKDLELYDDEGRGRLCEYAPEFAELGSRETHCGPSGNLISFFMGDHLDGGLGIDEGPPSWISILPGWHSTETQVETPTVHTLLSFSQSYLGKNSSYEDTSHRYFAVNPKVPDQDHPLWCVKPSILAEGVGSGHIGAPEDPGFYGEYQADGIVYDQRPVIYHSSAEIVHAETYDDARHGFKFTEQLAKDYTDRVGGLAQSISEGNITPLVQEKFVEDLGSGLRCTSSADIFLLDEDRAVEGGVVTEMEISSELVECTLSLCGNLTNAYSFEGLLRGILDTSESGSLDECPKTDSCIWEPYWDAYNDGCLTYVGEKCGEYLERSGYDTGGGVGLLFTVETDGPFLLTERVEGPDNIGETGKLIGRVGETNCLIGTSEWFDTVERDLPGILIDLGFTPCPSLSGSSYTARDGFKPLDQAAPGMFENNWWWGPTEQEGFGKVCLLAIMSVKDTVTVTRDTIGTITHTPAESPVAYGGCLEYGFDEVTPWKP